MKENWKYKKLGEIAEISSGNSAPQGDIFFENGIYPFVRTGDVGKIHFSSNFDTTDDNLNELGIKGLRLFPKGSILFPKSGASTLLNHRVRLSVDAYVVSHLAVIIPNEKIIDGKFLLYHTTTIDSANLVNDISYPSLRTSDLENLSIPVPPLSVQRQIVAELDLLSDIIEKQKQQIAELDKLAQATFYDMFGDPVTNEKGWERLELGKICDVRDGTHDSPEYYENGYPLVTSKNIIDGCISFDNVNYICETDYINICKRSQVDDGDIIMPMIGTIGKPIIVKKDRNFAIKNVALIKFVNDSKVSNIFIQSIMSSRAFDEYMKSKNKGGTQKFIALGDIRKLNIPVPPLSLQQSFASRIEAIERQKELISNSIKESRKLFDSRMEHWFG